MQSVFIGRQPILDSNGALFGYELLCRDAAGKLAIVGNGDRQSTQILLDAILSIGLERLAPGRCTFINVTETLVLGHLIDTLPASNVVLEILETVAATPALVQRLRALKARRFTIALDDFVLQESTRALLPCADIVKLDVRALAADDIERHVRELRRYPLKLLAEKVETQDEYARLRDLGFDLFQGYYFAHPELYTARALRPNRAAVLQLLSRVNEPDVTVAQMAALIRNDVALSVALLRWANAAGTGLTAVVESIDKAIIALGMVTIQNWLGLIALAKMGSKASVLVTTVLVRARSCELMAQRARLPDAGAFFTVGLFSALDVMMEAPMESLLAQLPLADHLKAALREHTGRQGAALKAVIAMELGDSAAMHFEKLPDDTLAACYVEAIEWADRFISLAG